MPSRKSISNKKSRIKDKSLGKRMRAKDAPADILDIFKTEQDFVKQLLRYLEKNDPDSYDRLEEGAEMLYNHLKAGNDWEEDVIKKGKQFKEKKMIEMNETLKDYRVILYMFEYFLTNPPYYMEDIERDYESWGKSPWWWFDLKGGNFKATYVRYEDLEEIVKDWSHYKEAYPNLLDENSILLFRSINVDSPDEINFSELKPFWSWLRTSAEPHWGYTGGKNEYIVVGIVDRDKIDWKGNIFRNMNPSLGMDEREILLGESIPVTVIDILKRKDKIDKRISKEDIEKLKEIGIEFPYTKARAD